MKKIMKKMFYELNADKYINESINLKMDNFYKYMQKYLLKKDDFLMLDLGFGSGRDMIYFKNNGYKIKGVDSCSAFVNEARKKELDVSLEVLPNMDNIENEKYDLIYSIGLVMHLNESERLNLFNNIKLKLKKNGLFVLSYNTQNRENDKERLFYTLSKDKINKEVDMTLIDEELMPDNTRDFVWIVETYKKN